MANVSPFSCPGLLALPWGVEVAAKGTQGAPRYPTCDAWLDVASEVLPVVGEEAAGDAPHGRCRVRATVVDAGGAPARFPCYGGDTLRASLRVAADLEHREAATKGWGACLTPRPLPLR